MKAFGEINLFELLQSCDGIIQYDLIDAGMVRKFSQEYEFEVDKSDNNFICITPKTKGRKAIKIRVPVKVPITPQLLIFFGMYDGDGNKTGNIGFAQNNTELQSFVSDGIEKIFPKIFPSRVNILEDTKYFESKEIEPDLQRISKILEQKNKTVPSHRDICEAYLLEEFRKMKLSVGVIQDKDITITISPKKGSGSVGKRSYEIIIDKVGSSAFRILLISIIKASIDSILNKTKFAGINWHQNGLQILDLTKYIKTNCRYALKNGKFGYYSITKETGSYLEVSKYPKGGTFKLAKMMPITPLLCIMFGIYWAEGTTTKHKLLSFRQQNESGLNLGFNSSENSTLKIFLDTIKIIFPKPEQIISGWLVKIGAKYHAEATAVASKLGVPIARGGPGGDGIARTVELTKVSKEWALSQFPIMLDWDSYFTHIEFTGAGIPRVDIRCSPSSSQLLFSIMADLTFDPDSLLPYLI